MNKLVSILESDEKNVSLNIDKKEQINKVNKQKFYEIKQKFDII